MGRSIVRIILGNVFGFIIFLILLGLANLFVIFIESGIASDIVSFFNHNIFLILVMVFFNMISQILWALRMPFNLFAPIASALLSFFIIKFIENIFKFICSLIAVRLSLPFWILYIIIPIIVLIMGYIKIISRQKRIERKRRIRRRKEQY